MAQVPQAVADAIVDPKAYASLAVDEAFMWLRREAPFAHVQPTGYEPMWVVTRHADLLEAERLDQLFCSGNRMPTLAAASAAEQMLSNSGAPRARTLVQLDSPEHMELRRLTQSWFMPKNLKALEADTRALAREFADKLAGFGGRCDFARDIALYYPLRVIMDILGVPPVDEPKMLKLTQEMFGQNDPELSRAGAAAEDPKIAHQKLMETMIEFAVYFTEITENRRKNPTNDLASAIANGIIRGEPIGPAEAIGYYIITATAGHDTTSSTTSEAMWVLAEQPELLARLQADPKLIPAFVEESIRWATPVKHFMRTATQDAEFAGRQVAQGDRVMLSYHSANRDESVFDRPFSFDIDRGQNKQAAFGYGPHVCLGQHLARLEMRLFWEELIPRLKHVALDGEPRRMQANFVSGPKSVPIRYEMH
jgi:cytochrome P450